MNLIEALRELLGNVEHILEYWNGNTNERAMHDALEEILATADKMKVSLESLLATHPVGLTEEQVREVLQDVVDLGMHGLWSGKRSTVDKAAALLSPAPFCPECRVVGKLGPIIHMKSCSHYTEPAPAAAPYSPREAADIAEGSINPATGSPPAAPASDVDLVKKWRKQAECNDGFHACTEAGKDECADELAAWLPVHDAQVCADAREKAAELCDTLAGWMGYRIAPCIRALAGPSGGGK